MAEKHFSEDLDEKGRRGWARLTTKQRRFVAEYIKTRNASVAAHAAGYTMVMVKNAYRIPKSKAIKAVLDSIGTVAINEAVARTVANQQLEKVGILPRVDKKVKSKRMRVVEPIPADMVKAIATAEWIMEQFILEARSALEGGTRVRALENLAQFAKMYPAKEQKIEHTHYSMRSILDEIDGVDTLLPPPIKQLTHDKPDTTTH